MTRQWDTEKGLLDRVHRLKEELERVKIEAAAAVRVPSLYPSAPQSGTASVVRSQAICLSHVACTRAC